MERSASRSVSNRYHAELAAEAGLNAAIAQILIATSSNQTFVTGLYTNVSPGFGPVTAIGVTNLADTNQLMPLISTDFSNLTNFSSNTWAGFTNIMSAREGTNSVDLNFNNAIENNSNTNFYRAPWVIYSTNSLGITRYSYYVLDDQARVNPLLAGTTSALTNSTNWYSDPLAPRDLIFTNSSAPLLTTDQQDKIFASTNGILTAASFAQAITSKSAYENIKHLITTSKNPSYDVVPASFPVLTGSVTNFVTNRAKLAINNFATNPNPIYGGSSSVRADNLGNLINEYLPNLGSRDPTLRVTPGGGLTYLRRLAAPIIDYITPPSAPTTIITVNGVAEPAGQKLTPQVTAIAMRYRRTALTPTSTSIESQAFVQVWNPYTTEISLSNTPIRLVIRNRMKVNFGTGIVSPFNDYDRTITPNLRINPNEFVVLEFPTTTPAQTWISPTPTATTPTITAGFTGTASGTENPSFEFYYNGTKINSQNVITGGDGGLYHTSMNFNTASDEYHCNFIPTEFSGSPWRFVGDPRASYLTSYEWRSPITASYTTLTWWQGRQPNAPPRGQDFVANWVNRDFVRANPTQGVQPANINQNPAQITSPYNTSDAINAISVIRNGPMRSIGELGHIFDPAQADDQLAVGMAGKSGGGRTLRIGQPEFQVNSLNSWSTNTSNPADRSAIQLLDVLSANPTNAAGFPFAIGRINPNTASVEVLSAILSGIKISSDAGTPNPSYDLANVTNLANTIITNRPYNKLSDFQKFIPIFAAGTNYSPAIPSSTGGGTTNLAVMDRMREEAFGKLVPHLTVQPRTYRVFVMGELLDRALRPVSRSHLEALVFFEINPSGDTSPVIQWRSSL